LHQNAESNSSHGQIDEFLYYQSSDGQPCFLSGINVACLMHEFSLHQNTEENGAVVAGDVHNDHTNEAETLQSTDEQQKAASKPRHTLPLPDELTGTIVEAEQLPVTTNLIKRKPFLSHIPLSSTVSFVEIDWYSGGDGGNKPMLSHGTSSKFRGELQRRKTERQRAAKREQKADKAAKAKSEKDEQRRRRELRGLNYVEGNSRQDIDPDDEFFRAPAESFDETEEAAQWNRTPTFQFNEVCATGGVWPELAPSMNSPGNEETAAAQSSPASRVSSGVMPSSPPKPTSTWGSSATAKLVSSPKPAKPTIDFPTLSESSQSTQKPKPQGQGKVKNLVGPWSTK